MNPQYLVAGERLDLLDLKVALVTRSVQVSNEIYEKFGETARISRNPRMQYAISSGGKSSLIFGTSRNLRSD